MFDVVFFKTIAGNQPVLDWLRDQNDQDRTVLGEDLRTVQMGYPLGMPLCRPLGDGLLEVRSSLPSKKEARLIFFQEGTTLVIVGGFVKKTKTTPKSELDKAKSRKNEYLRNLNQPTAATSQTRAR